MYTSNVCLSCIKYMYTIYKLYIVCLCRGCCKLVFFTGKTLVYNSLDRTLILHAYDPTSFNPDSYPAWSGHVTCADTRDQFASGKHSDNIIT